MTPVRTRIIGIGQDAAGDDGAGIAAARYLRTLNVPDGIEVIDQADPSGIIPYLTDGADLTVLLDAVIDAGPSGRVIAIDPSKLEGGRLLSTHGIGVLEAIGIARAIGDSAKAPRIAIIGITIDRPTRHGAGLSDRVAAAVPIAARQALELAAEG
jgi:hydrogenase maturation protease